MAPSRSVQAILFVYIPWSSLLCHLNILKRLSVRSPPAHFNSMYTCSKISLDLAWEITNTERSACLKAYLDYSNNSNLSFQLTLFQETKHSSFQTRICIALERQHRICVQRGWERLRFMCSGCWLAWELRGLPKQHHQLWWSALLHQKSLPLIGWQCFVTYS